MLSEKTLIFGLKIFDRSIKQQIIVLSPKLPSILLVSEAEEVNENLLKFRHAVCNIVETAFGYEDLFKILV